MKTVESTIQIPSRTGLGSVNMLRQVTPLVLTYNEAPNLERTLERLTWAKEIIIVDSGSTDDTLAIAARFPQVRVLHRPFDDHTAQWNFGLSQVQTPWVLALDADYVLTPELIQEMDECEPTADIAAMYARFRFCVFGRRLRGTLYPDRAVLFRLDLCRYVQDGHTQQLSIRGATQTFQHFIEHDDRKPVERWLWAQDRYAKLEVVKLVDADDAKLPRVDRLRKRIVFAPILVFFYTLFVKGCLWDGWAGWFYVWQRTLAEMILSLRLTERKLWAKDG